MNNGTESYIGIEEKIHYPKRQNEADRAVEVGTASLDSGRRRENELSPTV